MPKETDWVLDRLEWAEREGIWPKGERYLWTDAFGVVLMVSLYEELGDQTYLDRAEWLVDEVERVLGRDRGIRIGEDKSGQYFHYLSKWLYALHVLSDHDASYRERALELIDEIHDPFVYPGVGVYWRMKEDLSGPKPGYGMGALDAFDGYVVYRLIDEGELADEIEDLKELVDRQYEGLRIRQDLGLGMTLWLTHFFPGEEWARIQHDRALSTLDSMWVESEGYFCRHPGARETKFRFTNYGVSIGLQAVGAWPERVEALHDFFDDYTSGDEYDREAITHVSACCSHFPGRFLRPGVED